MPALPTIIIEFTGIKLRNLSKNIYFGGETLDKKFVEICGRDILRLKQGCRVQVLSNSKKLNISLGGTAQTIPLTYVLQVYEKETGKKIWQRTIVSSTPSTP